MTPTALPMILGAASPGAPRGCGAATAPTRGVGPALGAAVHHHFTCAGDRYAMACDDGALLSPPLLLEDSDSIGRCMVRTQTATLALDYVKTIGITTNNMGRGFINPYDVAFSKD